MNKRILSLDEKELLEKKWNIVSIERRIGLLEMALFGNSGNYWHDIKRLEDGTLVGCIGSMIHIIDEETGYAISKGFHEIKKLEDGSKVGSIGASIYLLNEETNAVISGGFHEIKPTGGNHYEGHLGAIVTEFTS